MTCCFGRLSGRSRQPPGEHRLNRPGLAVEKSCARPRPRRDPDEGVWPRTSANSGAASPAASPARHGVGCFAGGKDVDPRPRRRRPDTTTPSMSAASRRVPGQDERASPWRPVPRDRQRAADRATPWSDSSPATHVRHRLGSSWPLAGSRPPRAGFEAFPPCADRRGEVAGRSCSGTRSLVDRPPPAALARLAHGLVADPTIVKPGSGADGPRRPRRLSTPSRRRGTRRDSDAPSMWSRAPPFTSRESPRPASKRSPAECGGPTSLATRQPCCGPGCACGRVANPTARPSRPAGS